MIAVLVLAGALLLSGGVVLHRPWLLWLGVSIAGAAWILTVFALLDAAWFWARAPRLPVTFGPRRSKRCSQPEPAGSLRDKSDVIGGWLRWLT